MNKNISSRFQASGASDALDFIDSQIAVWPLARRNYQALGQTERRRCQLGDLTVGIQHNPARMVSTAAKTDAGTLASRPCFLCRENRPAEQAPVDFVEGWELLLNPFPIFPTHFTIVDKRHAPQEGFPLDMIEMAERLPRHTVFFNGSRAGASCPDHRHCQAVLTRELPLMCLVERSHTDNGKPGWHVASPESLGLRMPFTFRSIVVTPDMDGMRLLADIENIIGKEYIEKGLLNVFVWIDNTGLLRIVAIPRGAHRPSCYGSGPGQMMISPGCIDMAGVVITPRREDFDTVTPEQLLTIYTECGIPAATSVS